MYLGVASRTCKTSPIVDPRSEYLEQLRVIAHSAYSVCTPPDGTTPLFLLFPVLFRRASSCSERHPSFRCCYLCRTLLPLLVPLFSSSQLCFCALYVCTTVCSFVGPPYARLHPLRRHRDPAASALRRAAHHKPVQRASEEPPRPWAPTGMCTCGFCRGEVCTGPPGYTRHPLPFSSIFCLPIP